jgi:transglutaminase-like putative cysteine protease
VNTGQWRLKLRAVYFCADHPEPSIRPGLIGCISVWEINLKIRAGYDIAFECHQEVPMVLLLSVHPSREKDFLTPHRIELNPGIKPRQGRDPFGNIWTRFLAPAGHLEIRTDFLIRDSGLPDEVAPRARQWEVQALPDDILPFLYGSRYCDTQKLTDLAWSLFGPILGGWERVQAICDYVHDRIRFGYHHARGDRTASEGHEERVGVCRDFAHLAVTLCRCMNIPARYCTGYLGDVGVPKDPAPMDFSAWFEVFLDGRWFTFDARHNIPRIGRIVIARGRDAADVAISTQFGNASLVRFNVVTDEVRSREYEVVDDAAASTRVHVPAGSRGRAPLQTDLSLSPN